LMYLGPMLIYTYSFYPLTLYRNDLLETFFPSLNDLVYVQAYNLLAISLFCIGMLMIKLPPNWRPATRHPLTLSPRARQYLYTIGLVFGGIGVAAFLYLLWRNGGIAKAYGHRKGGLSSPSGYLSEAQTLTLPAIILVSMAWQGRRITKKYILLILVFAAPHLIHGFLSTSRGVTFVILATLALSQYLRTLKVPTSRAVFGGIAILGLIVLFLFAHRSNIYIGADFKLDASKLEETIAPKKTEISSGDNYVFASGLILHTRYFQRYYWGRRYAVILLVRPIPKQIWPTKYEDTGMGWIKERGMVAGSYLHEWLESVGWLPQSGSAAGFAADMYVEFAWGGVIVCFLLGLMFGELWKKFVLGQGIWPLLYVAAAVLSIYIPTQSLSAFLHRFLFMSVPVFLLWKFVVVPHLKKQAQAEADARKSEAVYKTNNQKPEPPPGRMPDKIIPR